MTYEDILIDILIDIAIDIAIIDAIEKVSQSDPALDAEFAILAKQWNS